MAKNFNLHRMLKYTRNKVFVYILLLHLLCALINVLNFRISSSLYRGRALWQENCSTIEPSIYLRRLCRRPSNFNSKLNQVSSFIVFFVFEKLIFILICERQTFFQLFIPRC